jgi:hypothetical protein
MDLRSVRCFKLITVACVTAMALTSCGGGESPQQANNQLSSPTLSLSGPGTNALATVSYLFANRKGTIAASGNLLTASFSDPYLPLVLDEYSGVFTDQVYSGSCTSLSSPIASVAGGSGNQVVTQISATGCSDQTVLNVSLDTSQIFDQQNNEGGALVSLPLTVDLAPAVTTVATGNTATDGAGTTESAAGLYSLASDQSIVVTFSKSLAGGTLNATFSGCSATLNPGTVVPGTNGLTVAWTLSNSVSSGTLCALNVSSVQDAAGNPDDPNDPNQSMNITFK